MTRVPALTLGEARAIYTQLQNAWAPSQAYDEHMSALRKLSVAGVRCRDCAAPGIHPHRLGGKVCDKHQPQET